MARGGQLFSAARLGVVMSAPLLWWAIRGGVRRPFRQGRTQIQSPMTKREMLMVDPVGSQWESCRGDHAAAKSLRHSVRADATYASRWPRHALQIAIYGIKK